MSQTQRQIRDKALEVSTAHPAAAATANAKSLDLVLAGNVVRERMELVIEADALPSLADTKKATLTVQDSADNVNFAAIDGLATIVQTGIGADGAAGVTKRIALPSITRRYIRVSSAVEAAGGDNTAKGFKFYLAF